MSETRTIVFANRKGGCGKTTLSSELFHELTRRGSVVDFFNLDNQGGCSVPTTEHEEAEFAVVDTPGYIDDAFGEICANADLVLIPCKPSTYDQEPTETAWQLACEHAPQGKVFLIINEYDARCEIDQQFLEYVAGSNMRLLCTIPRSTKYCKSAAMGIGVYKLGSTAKPAICISHMADRVLEVI